MVAVERTVSECSDDIDIRPLELSDLTRGIIDEESDDEERKNAMTGLTGSDKFFSVVYGLKKKESCDEAQKKLRARMAWKNAFNKIKKMDDPWKKFHIGQFKTEKAKRYRYKALQKKWVEDYVTIKMDNESFNHGAMRECFRMKKLSNFCNADDWSKALNYVAKRYIDRKTPRKTYFDDVKLQMDAKLWGEEFNRHNPPKKVDIFQMVVLELYEREDSPLYHVEHFIEGSYIKYNSNSGYVSKKMRNTPHAFSHFTFEKSGHELIVVDVQGVGDLYTDPQIHTAHGNDYGDGNLGTRGMALFFHSHTCNYICRSLGLSEFDLAPSELIALKEETKKQSCPKTRIRGTEELVIPATEEQRNDFNEYFRQRSISSGCSTNDDETILASLNIGSLDSLEDTYEQVEESEDSAIGTAKRSPPNQRPARRRRVGSHCLEYKPPNGLLMRHISCSDADSVNSDHLGYLLTTDFGLKPQQPRRRMDSSESECDSMSRKDQDNFSNMNVRRSRPSRIVTPDQHAEILQNLTNPRSSCNNAVLGQVHLDVAKYHELNRFSQVGCDYDQEAALFHIMQAAYCGVVDGLLAAAQLHLGLPHYILPDVEFPEDKKDEKLGFTFLEEACRAGDRWAIVYVANALETGIGLPVGRERNWDQAMTLFERLLNNPDTDDEGSYDAVEDAPPYSLRARQAAMLLQGGYGLQKDPNRAGELYSEAAELATEAMKGKLASKYYMEAENAWSQCEEEEE